jgi:DNA-binding CsgD family transcriptional regulator
MSKLSRKQWAAVELLARHMTSKEIARELGISPHTVDQRLTGAMRKLGAVNRRELARLALALCLGLSLPLQPLPGAQQRLLH